MGKKASNDWKLPTRVYVGQYRLDVVTPDPVDMDNNEVEGRYLPASGRIELRVDRPQDSLRDTLFHEVLHAVLDLSGLKQILDLDKDLEENLVRGLSPSLLQVMRDNPRLMDFLLV